MEGLVCREATREKVHDVLRVRNTIFPPLTPEEYLADPTMTCSIAYLDDEPVGAIPLSLRPFQLARGVIVQAAFENAVGTREDMRSRGIGTAMIDAARGFLAGRCDELMVYRGAERSDGYRFYVNSGHRDLVYLRQMVLDGCQRREADVAVQGVPEVHACQPELLKCFDATYGHCGGFPPRHVTYWEQQLRSQIYTVLPQETHLIRHPAEGALQAYVLAAFRTARGRDDSLRIIEVAGKGEEAITQSLMGLEDFAARRGLGLRIHGSAEHPCLPVLRKLGYREEGRSTMIMAQPIAPAELFARVCRNAEALGDLKIDFWAPFGDGTLFEGPDARTEVTLEGKDEVIYRLLNLRLDVSAAVRTEWLTVRNGSTEIVDRLAQALPYTPWVYHHLDYI